MEREERKPRGRNMTRKRIEELRCANGIHCVAYPALGEPSKLSRGNPGTRCFACEERRAASKLKVASAKGEKDAERATMNEPRWGKSNGLEEHAEADSAREVLERRRRSVLTCERGLRSALSSGDERLVRRWSRSLREAEERLAWAEATLEKTEKRVRSDHAR
jgi:hypothetical protein